MERDRFRGALLGLATGDALGTTVEFKPRGSFPPVRDITGGGPFGLPAGAWTDDTSMALCLAESLIERRGFDPIDQLERYVRWYRDGHWSSTGRCFDIGNATRAALTRFERTGEPYPGDADPDAAGNGPIMKLAPLAMAFAHDEDAAAEHAALSARTTHGAPQAIETTQRFARLLVRALNGAGKDELLERPVTSDPRGTGYIVESLEAALWAFAEHDDFESGALAAVNLGDDADTTGAVYGQLAGAHYGVNGIPSRWRSKLVRHDEIVAMADRLLDLATSWQGRRASG
jgi:ADP-ribosyl-[dinitrogen reductase] hydrolase